MATVNQNPVNAPSTLPENVNKLALVVGVNNSVVSRYLATLMYAENDASEMAAVLQQPACNFELLNPPLVGELATTADLRRAILKLVRNKTEQDFLLFYFSGHSFPMRTRSNREDIYLVTHDFDPSEAQEDSNLYISMSWLRETLYQRSQAGRVLLILDCSYAGNILHLGSDADRMDLRDLLEESLEGPTPNTSRNRSRIILASTMPNSVAREDNGHGLMTGLLIRALRGEVREALDYNGQVEILTLYKYLRHEMPSEQEPILSGDIGPSFVLASYPSISLSVPLQAPKDQQAQNATSVSNSPSQQAQDNAQPQTIIEPTSQVETLPQLPDTIQDPNATVPSSGLDSSQRSQDNSTFQRVTDTAPVSVSSQQSGGNQTLDGTPADATNGYKGNELPQTTRTPSKRIEFNNISALTDRTSDKTEDDALDFSHYVDAIVELIKSDKTQKPLTIAIDAAWGMGKTTLMKMIQKRMDSNEKETSFPTVWFDAWKYDKEYAVWAALALTILRDSQKYFSIKKRIQFWWKLNLNRLDGNFPLQIAFKALPYILYLIPAVVLVFIVVWLWIVPSLQETIGLLVKASIILFGGGIFSVILATVQQIYVRIIKPSSLNIAKYIKDPNNNLVKQLRGPNYEEQIGFLAQFEEDFKSVIATITDNGNWPLVVFIEDLDRCAPDNIVQIIEAINILLDTEHCIFILGMDSQVVAGCIGAKYKDLHGYIDSFDNSNEVVLGQHFLEKIVQINFRIPRPDLKLMRDFVNKNLKTLPNDSRNPLSNGETGGPDPGTQTRRVAGELILAEMRGGKSADEAVQVVEKKNPSIATTVLGQAKQEIIERFGDSEEVKNIIHEVLQYLEFNPRKVKRFINSFRLQAFIAIHRKLVEKGLIDLNLLAKWIIITTRWPNIIRAIIIDQDFIKHLMDYYQAKEKWEELRLSEKPEDEKVATLYQRRIEFYQNNPYIKSMPDTSSARELLQSLKDIDNQSLLRYLHLAQITT